MSETWKDVPGYAGLYQVSDIGRLRSLDRQTRAGLRPGKLITARVPKRGGYPQVHLSRNGRKHSHRVHALVLEAFSGPRPLGMVACHNDGVRTNCASANLRWATRVSNEADKRKHGTALHQSGELNHSSKLTESDARRIIAMRKRGAKLAELARLFGITIGHVSEITRGKTWAHLWK